MTKTVIRVLSHRFANPGLSFMTPLGTTVEGFFFWNFGFVSLGFFWDLVFGAWNFSYFHRLENFLKIR